ncbi:MAG: prolyl oligopeptidase family serine peptidase [Elusimicrobia bacterium]|nr:prolyl oligopeptidase family serine peptidase [Elusimicrobiota bacterium]
MNRPLLAALIAASILLGSRVPAAAQTAYQKPPKEVLDVLHAPAAPDTVVSPVRDAMILATPVRYPSIAYLAEPMLRLAGVRVIPRTRRPQNAGYWSVFRIVALPGGEERAVELPADAKVGLPAWSADGKRFAFVNLAADSVELWVGDAATARVRRIEGIRLNPFFGRPLQWMPDQKTLLVRAVPGGQGAPPAQDEPPRGPSIQETSGEKGASSTYEVRDVLKSQKDEELFSYYGMTQFLLVDAETGRAAALGVPGLYASATPAPGAPLVLVETIHRPFSYLTTHERFPREVDVLGMDGRLVYHAASVPLADRVPIWGVRTGPRDFGWRATEPATLVWFEALDGGDWKTQVPHRDRVLMLKSPFTSAPEEVVRTRDRAETVWWGERGDTALVVSVDLIKHWTQTHAVDFDHPAKPARLIWDMSSDEAYHHPGWPVMKTLPTGARVVLQDKDSIYLDGQGASPEGDRPFLDRLDMKTLKAERLFRCDRSSYEEFYAWLDLKAGTFLTRRENPADPPNFFVRALTGRVKAPEGEATRTAALKPVTHLPDPTPQLRAVTKRLVTYKRADGIDLSFTLYLPPGYKEGTRLPAIVWAYPLDYADPKMAGQVTGSTHTFTTFDWPLHLFPLLEGYAILDNPLMPVVGDTDRIYDTYMEQLVAGAKAAVDKAVELGVVDRDRIGITGHSHGGLMTVNLLAHSDLFRAGVARSGAYNRSLTAFGFQNERRTLWEAPEVYTKVSPYFHADKIKAPLLLIHGALDVNPGTVPLQSEKLFEAIRGNGGTARLVMLPFESHGYRAMESTEQVLYEMLAWFDKYVKNAPPR